MQLEARTAHHKGQQQDKEVVGGRAQDGDMLNMGGTLSMNEQLLSRT